MIAALLSAALAIASPQPSAYARGFSADQLAQAAPRPDARVARAALARMQLVRASLILDAAGTPARLDPMEARALAAGLGRIDDGGAAHVAWFMRGASIRVGSAGGRTVAGFYNPLVDAWLIAPLDVVGGQFRITSASLVEGGAAPLWSEAPGANFAVLVDSYRAAMDGFDVRYDRSRGGAAPPSADAFSVVSARTTAWMASLGRWRAGAAGVAAAQAACQAIADGHAARSGLGDPGVAAQVDGLASATRRSLAVTGAVQRGDVVSLLLISPGRPDLILVLDLDARQRPVGLSIVNLGNLTAAGEGS